MKNNTKNLFNFELLIYALLAALSVSAIFYLFYNSPVYYTYLISEDHIAEYGTSVCFGLAGLILLALSFSRGPKVRRGMWMLIGVMALLIAAEEISWGQRIFNVATPDIISKHNVQEEITLHNLAALETVNNNLHSIASYLILTYLIFSLLVLTLMPRLEEKFTAIGLPLIQPRLVPVFLLAPYFLLFYPTSKSDEIGELFLGVAVLMWAVDLFLVSRENGRFNSFTSTLIMTGALLLAFGMSVGLANWHEKDITYRLNLMASRDYQNLGMYEQAQFIYDYIYQHPQHLNPRTRLSHARMLQATGKNAEATEVLSTAAKELEAQQPLKNSNSEKLRLLGITYMSLMDKTRADDYFDQSIEVDQKKLNLSTTADEKAEALWSISQTMQARGDIKSAITNIEQAITYAESPVLQIALEKLLQELVSL